MVLAVLGGGLPSALTVLAFDRLLDNLSITDDELVGWTSDRVPGVIALLATSAIAGWIGYLAITWLMLRTYDDEIESGGRPRPSTGDEVTASVRALAGAAAALPRAIGWGLLCVLAVAATSALVVATTVFALPLGILLIVAMFPLAIWVSIRLAFVIHAVVDASGNPYARSWVVSTERFWGVLGRVLLLIVVAGAVNYGANLIGALSTGGAAFGGATTFQVDTGDGGSVSDLDLDEVLDVTPLRLAATALSGVVSTLFGTSMVLAGCSELYRTRNRRPS